MARRIALLTATALIALAASPAVARKAARSPQPLANLLYDLSQRAGVGLLFDERLVKGMTSPPPPKGVPLQTALDFALRDTGIGYRRTVDGAFILYKLGDHEARQPSDGAISEILVVGSTSQNADIRRTENDIQPVKVLTAAEIADAHRDNFDQLLRSRLPANASALPPTLATFSAAGSTISQVDIHGLGPERSLVLVDGRRMPSLPSSLYDFGQPDLNALPLGAIDRVETLTGTAGGIYGPSAVGGVINVVLKRGYRGADLTVTSGITDRGDAKQIRLEGRVGFTPDGGKTDIMLFGSASFAQRLTRGDRDYDARARARAYANDPAGYLASGLAYGGGFPTNAILVRSATGENLTFKPQNGGASLGASFTYLPLGFSGSSADQQALLTGNAGKPQLELSPGYGGRDRSLANRPTTWSGLMTIRRSLGDHVHLFVDGLYLENHGEADVAVSFPMTVTLASAPSNPFNQAVVFNIPNTSGGKAEVRTRTYRVVGGAIVDLPWRWKADAEFSWGGSRYVATLDRFIYTTLPFTTAIQTGLPVGTGPAVNPLGDWSTFLTNVAVYGAGSGRTIYQENHFIDPTLRLSGPVAKLPGGDLTLTLLAEQRRENSPAFAAIQQLFGMSIPLPNPQHRQTVRSGYAELRAPLVPVDSAIVPLRGLELQLATRYDGLGANVAKSAILPGDSGSTILHRNAVSYTAGGRVTPVAGLTLRASYATGKVPPTLAQLQQGNAIATSSQFAPDPLRGGRSVGTEGPVSISTGGSFDIGQERGRTLAIGAVLQPWGRRGPRLSIDYTRIAIDRVIETFPLSVAGLVAVSTQYPDRVVRAALTDADRALGYTAGRITRLDLRATNSGRSLSKSVDFQFDWQIAGIFGGTLGPYAKATWQPTARFRRNAQEAWIEEVGQLLGPLQWRAEGGTTWRKGPTSLDLNLQYYHGYHVTDPLVAADINAQLVRFQDTARVPAQVYVDLAVSHRFAMPAMSLVHAIDTRLGVENLLDHAPPIIVNPNDIEYSAYGDPRGRRVEVSLRASF